MNSRRGCAGNAGSRRADLGRADFKALGLVLPALSGRCYCCSSTGNDEILLQEQGEHARVRICFRTCLLSSTLLCHWDTLSPTEALRGDYASASSPGLTCRKTRLHGCCHLIDSIIHLPCFKTCKELQRMLRNLHAGSAAPAPHSKRVLRGSTQHQRAGCGGLTMLLRWHSDERTLAKGLCM